MNHGTRRVIGGVDAHADSHHAAVLDDRGALLGSESFASTISPTTEALVVPALSGHRRQPYSAPRPAC